MRRPTRDGGGGSPLRFQRVTRVRTRGIKDLENSWVKLVILVVKLLLTERSTTERNAEDDMATALQTLATDKQVSFLRKLASERIAPFLGDSALKRGMTVNELVIAGLTKNEASELISNLLRRPFDATPTASVPQQRSSTQPKEVAAELTPGVYDVNGHVYVVKPNKAKTRLYANRLVEIATDRLNAEGDMVQIEFRYEAGAIFNIKPEHKMSYDDAKMLTIRYGRCIVCNRRLKAGKSVEQGIGPVCRKSFA